MHVNHWCRYDSFISKETLKACYWLYSELPQNIFKIGYVIKSGGGEWSDGSQEIILAMNDSNTVRVT